MAEIEVAKHANYIIDVEAEGYRDGRTEVSLDREVFVELEPEPVEHTIRIEDGNGEGIEGADVAFAEAATVNRQMKMEKSRSYSTQGMTLGISGYRL